MEYIKTKKIINLIISLGDIGGGGKNTVPPYSSLP
jgi:hypothetical protein